MAKTGGPFMSEPRATVIVLVWNGRDFLEACLDAVLAQDYASFGVIVVDNGSTDGSPRLVADRYPNVALLNNDRNLGFAAGNNVGLQQLAGTPRDTRTDFAVLLNQDTVVHPGWLASMARAFATTKVGITGCKLLYPNGTIQHAGGYLYGPRGETGHLGRQNGDKDASTPVDGPQDGLTNVEFVTGAALAISREALEKIGPLDEGFRPAYYEDVDWCYRARAAGYRVVYQPDAIVTHHESTTTNALSRERKQALNQGRLRFLLKHWTVDRLVGEFGPAELAWVISMNRCEELMAARRAYLGSLLGLPDILAFRRGSSEDADALVGLLTDLRAAAQANLTSIGSQGALRGDNVPMEPRQPVGTLEMLSETQTIREQPFTSHVPVVGRLIVAFRDLWNSMATKWYVRPMAQQQSLFNAQLVHYLRTVEQRLQGQSMDIAENIDELTILAQSLAGVEETESQEDTDG
jgi:GT2 family glycosyltransferase